MFNILNTIIIYPLTQIIEFIFAFSQKLFKETGISVIFISMAISILCLPLYAVAEKWQQIERDIAKKLKPKVDKIKKVFRGDEQYMVLSTYYRQNHYHPIYALRSTFGLLIQIPFFIAAYSYLSNLEALQGVSFSFIRDLGAPDALFAVGSFTINILPILMTLVNCIAGAIYTTGLPLKEKIQLYGMAGIFLILLYNSPSALVLYWTMNNVFSLIKNTYYKIPSRRKWTVIFGIISAISLLFAYYTLFVHHGSQRIRTLVAVLSLIVGVIPWIFPAIARLSKKIRVVQWSKKETFLIFAGSLLVLWVLTGAFIPSMLIGASPQEFSFVENFSSPLVFLFNTALQAFSLFIFWPFIIYFLFSPKTKKVLSFIMLITAFSATCNVFIFPGDYGYISKDLVFAGSVGHNAREIAVNMGILAVPLIILSFLYLRGNKKILSFLCIIVFTALFSYSIRNIYSINNDFVKLSEYYKPVQKTDDTISPLFHLSKDGKNILVIMLDMAESVFIPSIFDESPELREKFDGFVYFPNTVTFNGSTKGGAPPIFGGYEYTPAGMNSRPDVSLREKTNEALLLMPRLLADAGFSVTVSDPPYANDNWIPDLRIYNDDAVSSHITDGVYTDIWLKQNNMILPQHSTVLKRNILWYALFREIPLAFRQAVYAHGAWCEPFSGYRLRLFLNGYAVLDLMDKLTDFETSTANQAILMVNNTTHESSFLQAPEYRPWFNISNYGTSRFNKEVWYHVNIAAMKRLAEYFDFLKEHKVYDNTRIILVSDHAGLDATYVTKTGLPFDVDQFNALLLVKDFNATGAIKTDMNFMTNADVPCLAMEGVIENPRNPFTGNAIRSEEKSKPLPVIIKRLTEKSRTEIDITEHNTYYIHDNIFDSKNWIPAASMEK